MPRHLCSVICLGLLLLVETASGQQKKRVAVLSFDTAAVEASAAKALGTTQDVGASLADLLVKELLKGGAYSVIERRAIDQILKEQNFSNSSRTDSKTAAAIGRLLGVDGIIMGSVTQFGTEESAVAVGAGSLGRITRGVVGGAKRVNTTATVSMTARLVDTSTGEILSAASGSGQSSKASVGASGNTSLNMTASSFQDSMLGEAVNHATQQMATTLNEFGSRLAAVRVEYSGLVADVSGTTVILNIGTLKGAQVGDSIEISRAGRQILDPQTKAVIRTIVDTVGTARITEADGASATAILTRPATVRVGDQVKRVP